MSDQNAHFSVDTRLTRLLGETYRSSEAAIKELVDNAWDADASHVWISLPKALSVEPITVRDDGSGMTSNEMRAEYLNIASDKRTRTGEKTPRWGRRIKGRKGIGKFAGLTIADHMQVETCARGRKCILQINKKELIENQNDLEAVPLKFSEQTVSNEPAGTTVILSGLNTQLNFPTADRLREILIYEYGREDTFKVFVDDAALSVQDVPGKTSQLATSLPVAGEVKLHFTISDGKKAPRAAGIILKVNGKAVGKPQFFGLDEDEDIPPKLAKKVYGEVELSGVEDFVTADWGAVLENSKAYQEAREFIKATVKSELKETHSKEMSLQRARLQKQIQQRLQQLPENRRRFAEEALNRILKGFYGESEDRIATIAEVALDAMEHDAYWAVLENINASSKGDVGQFAVSLEEFGLVQLSKIAEQAINRRKFLDYLDRLISNPATLEKDAHKAFETNLWMLGRQYSTMSSNATLRSIVGSYCDGEFSGTRSEKRPDLLLSQDYGDSLLLIEFKRPSHSINREDVSQAEKYRDELSRKFSSSSKMEIMMIGKGRVATLDANNLARGIVIRSYESVTSSARAEIDWLIKSLGGSH